MIKQKLFAVLSFSIQKLYYFKKLKSSSLNECSVNLEKDMTNYTSEMLCFKLSLAVLSNSHVFFLFNLKKINKHQQL